MINFTIDLRPPCSAALLVSSLLAVGCGSGTSNNTTDTNTGYPEDANAELAQPAPATDVFTADTSLGTSVIVSPPNNEGAEPSQGAGMPTKPVAAEALETADASTETAAFVSAAEPEPVATPAEAEGIEEAPEPTQESDPDTDQETEGELVTETSQAPEPTYSAASTSTSTAPQTLNPYSYKTIANFSVDSHLPTQELRDLYFQWWELYETPDSYYQDPPESIFAAGDLSNSSSSGSYSYARAGSHYLQSIVEFIRSVGDPKALEELVSWSQRLALNLSDHDGRGYPFFQYMNGNFGKGYNQPYDPKYESSDTNFLDEQMLAGTIALVAHVLHENRSVSPSAAAEADFWFDYLANNWTPKWLARTTTTPNGENGYQPPASLGLANAVNWTHPTNPQHDDIHPTFSPTSSSWTPADKTGTGPDHMFPVRVFGHPYLMSLFQYWAMGQYFTAGNGTASTNAFTAADFVREAQVREDWWYQQTTLNSDGSRDFWLQMDRSNAGLYTQRYALHVSSYLNALHFSGVGRFASEDAMKEYAKVYYNGPDAGITDVYDAGNTQSMRKFANGGGGNDTFVMRSNALLSCWDETGELENLTRSAIQSTLRHNINGGTNWGDMSHFNALISCQTKEYFENGL